MPAFTALNVEPDETVVEEIDTTRELQVDDALKLFQNALKLHSQGPQFFDDAADAYDALFESEIFKYPEAKTEYERNERQPDGSFVNEPAFTPGLDVVGADADGIGSSLPQAYYLSYKNHGQFVVDRIRRKARAAKGPRDALFEDHAVQADGRRALDNFNAALDRDPSDADLWRKTARVAAFLKSARISRYSLEAAIELDDDPAVVEVEPPSLAEGFAGAELKDQLDVLGDEMAQSHPIMKPFVEKGLPASLERYKDPIPFLPNPTKQLAAKKLRPEDPPTGPLAIEVPSRSWTELGISLVSFAITNGLSGQPVVLQVPEEGPETDLQMEVDRQLQPPESSPVPEGADGAPTESAAAAKLKETNVLTEEPEATAEATTAAEQPTNDRGALQSSRKRSQSAAGLPDAQDEEGGDVKRSKRTRRRDTTQVEEVMDTATLLATQIQPFQAADQNLFQTTKDLLENLGVTDSVTLDRIAEILESCASEDRTGKIQNLATNDLREAIVNFDDDTANILLSKQENTKISLSAFLEHSKSAPQRALEAPAFDDSQGLASFVSQFNTCWGTIHDAAYEFVKTLAGTYAKFKWSDQTKTTVVQLISRLDESIYERTVYDLSLCHTGEDGAEMLSEMTGLVVMLFELHLDIYERITNPNSAVEVSKRVEARARLDRWMSLATNVAQSRSQDADDEISIRFLWASVIAAALSKDVQRDHIITCWHSLRDHLAESPVGEIALPNNVVMPEISTMAAEREISKLTTLDFFIGLFQDDQADPVSVIDTLEPVLNPESVFVNVPAPDGAQANGVNAVNGEGTKQKLVKQPIKDCAGSWLRDLWKFLQNSSTDMRLLLWARLGESYGKIKYTTKQFSCFLRSIETIVADLERDDYANTPSESRKALFMTNLKALDDLTIQSLHLALNDNSSFDIIDEDHLRATLSALAKVNCLLHIAAMHEDEVRIGMTQPSATGATYMAFLTKLREMQVRTWSLQYTVLKVGVYQHGNMFPKPENDLAEYLAAVHQVLGLRKCCKASNKIFLKMMRVELLKQKNIENWEDYLGQVLYDLHGLKLGVGIWDVQDHGCPSETLEKRQAMSLVDKITVLANRMTMKDLLKSDLKTTIDHMQQAIGSTKSNPQMILNLRNFTEYMKTPLHPLHLYQALTGNIDLDAVTINTPESALAKQGWFFLLGMIALTKFKGVDLNRRQTPGATDDLRIGAAFLRQQLQFTPDRWDAWFRLAECFDYELDEAVLWTADKMNKDRADLVKFQRNSIHCYTLALSHSYAWASDPLAFVASEEDADALYDLYHEFGMRLYASSREPFAMEPFQHPDQERFFIDPRAETYKKILHQEMSDYQVWKYAANLFRKAMAGKPKDWKNPYMVAKCLWKMYQKPLESLPPNSRSRRPTVQDVIRALEKSVEVVAALPKPRSGQDPILEPHYKILSVIHKLVSRGDLPAQEGADVLQRQPYAPDHGAEVKIGNADDWEMYVIKSLRFLRDKDKSNWQHRLIMRHARILFDENDAEGDGGGYIAAKAAFGVLRESMFTKTMVMNVWKCDAERPGRHHVYTEQYIRFMVRVLAVMNDRVNLEMVLRRIRKKGADFYHFNELWQSSVVTYVKMLRQSYSISLTEEDAFKSLSPEDFEVISERISEWAATPAAETHRAMSCMKETIELKKLNAQLMKAGPIDDLISDCYSAIYLELKAELPLPDQAIRTTEHSQTRDGDAAVEGTPEPMGKKLFGLLNLDKGPSALGSLRAASEQPEKPLSHAGEPAPRGRRPGVRRLDVIRKAEQAVLRAAEGPPKSAGASSKSRMGSASSGKNAADDDDEPNGDDEDVDMKDADEGEGEGDVTLVTNGDEADANDDGSDISSPPGSVHDSADDESDLSDVPADYEDDVPPSLMFPNLRRSVDAGTGVDTDSSETESSSEEGSTDDEGDEEGEQEAEEEVGEEVEVTEGEGEEGDGNETTGPEQGEEEEEEDEEGEGEGEEADEAEEAEGDDEEEDEEEGDGDENGNSRMDEDGLDQGTEMEE
ncbi:histone transcription regulator 3 [Podospora aff. communis PSN243]|uniref:Histone transcription regulator 3 homolog n=1 Tax=Podospora aff. communis PSN243 TaxID=3040156 RepID=A0AAV9GW70_9PEZI|nr:histone transcription regulator 3 [Podospora aff. communis PSN243]